MASIWCPWSLQTMVASSLAHYRHPARAGIVSEEILWAEKFIQLDFVWESIRPGKVAGLQKAKNMSPTCTRIFSCANLFATNPRRAGVSRIDIERFPGKVKVIVHTAKPGILIGRKGENVKKIRQSLESVVGKKIDLEIKEIKISRSGCLSGCAKYRRTARTPDQLPASDEALRFNKPAVRVEKGFA